MIQNAMKQIHYSVNTTKNAKSQVRTKLSIPAICFIDYLDNSLKEGWIIQSCFDVDYRH